MAEPLKQEDMIRGVIVNADEYKEDGIISPNKIDAVWINLESHKSAVEWLKEQEIKLLENYWLKEITWTEFKTQLIELKDKAFPDLSTTHKGGKK